MICTGHAFLNSGQTNIITIFTRVEDEYDGTKYYFLAIKDWVDEKTDIKRCIQWGNTLDKNVGELIIQTFGNNKYIKYKDSHINLRRNT